jgi:MFS family permease
MAIFRVIMNTSEKRATFSLASIFAVRMLGLFMILPVFSLYATHLSAATPMLIGIALGIYGLTQAIFQLPFGMISDRLGRKPLIAFGLIIFAAGSIIAASSSSIYGVIFGRALQGAGAVGSTIIALIADLTREEERTKAMAFIGTSVGITFAVSMVLGPVLSAYMNVSGIFWLMFALAIVGLFILKFWVPTPKHCGLHRDAEPVIGLIATVLKDRELLRLDFGILALHALLTANFVVIPIILTKTAGLNESSQWLLYLPVLLLAFISMIPMIILAEKKRQLRPFFLVSVGLLFVSETILLFAGNHLLLIGFSLYVFFTAFSFLEASLPSLISKQAPAGAKGTAMGIYSSSQFFGIFLGGSFAGLLLQDHLPHSIFLLCALITLVWFFIAARMKNPRYLTTQLFNVGKISSEQAEQLSNKLLKIPGVAEAVIIVQEGVAYLKVDRKIINMDELKGIF